jgi:phage repressor protein C with HTH and peptisase S24 domain
MFGSADSEDNQSVPRYKTVANEGMLASDISVHYGSVPEPEEVTSIPIVDIEAVAGGRSCNRSYANKRATITLPSAFLNKGKHNCIQVHDQSMMPTLQSGSYLIIRFLERSEWVSMKDGNIYLFSVRDGRTHIKRVRNRLREHGFIVCMSDNPDKVLYPDFNLTDKDLTFVWSVEWYMSPQMPNIGATYDSKLRRLDDDMDEIRAMLDRLMHSSKEKY